ncbi:hypothetical protein DFJ77DRAFT_213271 [Powellomyces hirtus]|nr:hypothetical protein DFJ77DRAFT_213271 [Powellomyces hirtus]
MTLPQSETTRCAQDCVCAGKSCPLTFKRGTKSSLLRPAKFGLRAAHLQWHLHNLQAPAAAGTNSQALLVLPLWKSLGPMLLASGSFGKGSRSRMCGKAEVKTRHAFVSECHVRKPKETMELPLCTPLSNSSLSRCFWVSLVREFERLLNNV